MKTTSILLTVLVCLWWGTPARAQFRIGAEAGYVNSHYRLPKGTINDAQDGFLAGVMASYTLRTNIWLESGLTIQQKGIHFDPLPNDLLYPSSIKNVKLKAFYLDVPLLVGYKFNALRNWAFIPKAGAFLSYGLHGTASFTGENHAGEPFSVEYNAFNTLQHRGNAIDPQEIRYKYDRVDVGLQAGLDVMWKQYVLRAAYKYSLNEHSFFTDGMNGRTLSVSLAYYFWQK